MLLVVHASNPALIFATHSDDQLDEILVAYPASDYGIYSSESAGWTILVPLPADAVLIREVPPYVPPIEPQRQEA